MCPPDGYDLVPVDHDPWGGEFGNAMPEIMRTYRAGKNYRAGMDAAGDAVIDAATAGPVAVGKIATGQGSWSDVPDALLSLAPELKIGAGLSLASPLLGMSARLGERELFGTEAAAGRALSAANRSAPPPRTFRDALGEQSQARSDRSAARVWGDLNVLPPEALDRPPVSTPQLYPIAGGPRPPMPGPQPPQRSPAAPSFDLIPIDHDPFQGQ